MGRRVRGSAACMGGAHSMPAGSSVVYDSAEGEVVRAWQDAKADTLYSCTCSLRVPSTWIDFATAHGCY
jgi:hypothetical protein